MTDTEKWINESLKSLPHLCAEIRRLSKENDVLRSKLEHFREVTKKVEPLTLDELRQMDGEPVWVCFSGSIIYEDGWFIITETKKCEALLKGKVLVYKDFECYGKTWLAYRQKPEEGTV